MVQRSAPLAEQLVNEIAAEISAGHMVGDGGRLPSETDLCQRYAVSRATVREALSKLEMAGVVIRRQGVGTFVNQAMKHQPGLVRGWLDEAPAFVDLIAQSGHKATCELLGTTTLAVTDRNVADQLGISVGAQVISISKLFFADARAIIYSHTLLPDQLLATDGEISSLPDAVFREPIYKLLAAQTGSKVHHQASEIKAVLADDTLARLLACPPGAPLLQVEETGYSQEQTALFLARHHFHGDRVSFRQIRIPSFAIDPS